MPYQQQRFVSLVRHDENSYDVNVIYRDAFRVKRYSVLIPRAATRDQVFAAAVGLATYVRLSETSSSIFVRKDHIFNALRRVQLREQADAARAMHPPVERAAPPDRPAYQKDYTLARDALVVAKELLRSIDPGLLAKMDSGHAFYFKTAAHTYIWYPNSRAIVSLEEDSPKYVCVHSRDFAVESNTYDWAITMRTYLLANEEHWRRKANFHQEYGLRGASTDYEQLPCTLPPPTRREEN